MLAGNAITHRQEVAQGLCSQKISPGRGTAPVPEIGWILSQLGLTTDGEDTPACVASSDRASEREAEGRLAKQVDETRSWEPGGGVEKQRGFQIGDKVSYPEDESLGSLKSRGLLTAAMWADSWSCLSPSPCWGEI